MEITSTQTREIQTTIDLNEFIECLAKEVGVSLSSYALDDQDRLMIWERSSWEYEWKVVPDDEYKVLTWLQDTRQKLLHIKQIKESFLALGVLTKEAKY